MKVADLKKYYERLTRQRGERRQAREKELRLLPADLTGHIFNAARQEAQRIKKRLDELQATIPEVEAAIDEAEKEVRAAFRPVMQDGRRRGDILFDYEIEELSPRPGAYLVTKEALEIRKEKVRPLRRRLEALRRAVFAREQELGELRKIAEKSAAGEIALINFLSQKWSGRLEIGPGVMGTIAKLRGMEVIPSDASGSPLPVEAVNPDGSASMSMEGRPAG